MYLLISALYSLDVMSCMYISVLMHISVLYIVSISRHVCVCMCVCVYVIYIHTYMHTYIIYFLLIMLCKFVNKMYIKSHDMRKHMVSVRGGGADQKKKKTHS